MAIQDTNLQSNRQHAVPQNIMDVEFKIIGDLTMRQFAYLMILGLLSYFNTQFMVGIFKWPLTIFFMVLGLALAFIPVQDRGLDVWLVNFIKSVYAPTQMVWRKTVALPSAFLYDSLNVMKQELITLAPTTSRRKLGEYLDYSHKILPRDPLDIPEAEYVMKVRQMSQNNRNADALSQSTFVNNTAPDLYNTPVVPKPIASFISQTVPQPKVSSVVSKIAPVMDESLKEKSTASFGSFVSKLESNIGSAIKNITAVSPKDTEGSSPARIPVIEKSAQKVSVEEIATPARRTASSSLPVTTPSRPIRDVSPVVARRSVSPVTRASQSIQKNMDSPIYSTLTPDRHSGRKFTSFLPEQGELILPIRGERMLKTSDQVKMEESIEEKTEKLQQLLSQIRHSTGQDAKVIPTDFTTEDNTDEQLVIEDRSPEVAPVKLVEPSNTLVANMSIKGGKVTESIEDFTVAVEPLSNISSIKNQVAEQSKSSPVSTIPTSNHLDKVMAEVSQEALTQLTKRRESILTELSSLRSNSDPAVKDKVSSLQKILQQVNAQYQQLKKQFQDVAILSQAQSTLVSSVTPRPKFSSESTISNAPSMNKANILWGFVKTDTGKPITDTVVIVKNMRGEPVRATKTNALGQFTLTTQINTGKYNIEVSSNNKSGLLFDIISVEASGNVIPPVEFIGRKGN